MIDRACFDFSFINKIKLYHFAIGSHHWCHLSNLFENITHTKKDALHFSISFVDKKASESGILIIEFSTICNWLAQFRVSWLVAPASFRLNTKSSFVNNCNQSIHGDSHEGATVTAGQLDLFGRGEKDYVSNDQHVNKDERIHIG